MDGKWSDDERKQTWTMRTIKNLNRIQLQSMSGVNLSSSIRRLCSLDALANLSSLIWSADLLIWWELVEDIESAFLNAWTKLSFRGKWERERETEMNLTKP